VPLTVPAFGAVVTVTVLVAVTFEHPPVPVTVYVIVDVPATTGVITPVVEFTVAIVVALEVHDPPVFPFELNVVVLLVHNAWFPLIVPAFGAAVIVTSLIAVAFKQPPVPVTVYVIVSIPAATPVTNPDEALTVAIDNGLEVHTPPELPLLLKEVVPLEHIA